MNVDEINEKLNYSNMNVSHNGILIVEGKEETVPISNFVYWIREIVSFDDGQEEVKVAICEGLLKGKERLPPVRVPFEKMQTANWPLDLWGVKCIFFPRQSSSSQLFFAAQLLSNEVVEKTVYAHLGWQKISGDWCYLHSGGAIGIANAEVQIDQNLDRYKLPRQVKNPADALENVSKLHQIARTETIVPLIALAFLAPLVELFKLGGRIPNFVLLLYGQTGTRKTSLALIIQSFFGDFGTTSPPSSFKDTANAIELKAFKTKDSLLLVDDFHPQSTTAEARAMQQNFQKLLRGYGDRIGRARMGSNLKMRKSYPPRGMALITGEDLPRGHSSSARFLGLEVERDEINLKVLSDFQGSKNKLKYAMRVFVEWIQPQFEKISDMINNRFSEVRGRYIENSNHGRSAEAVAYLQIAYEVMIMCMVEYKVVSESQVDEMLDSASEIFAKIVENQNDLGKQQSPVEQFVVSLTEMLNRGKVTLADRKQPFGTHPGSGGTAIGWSSDTHLYLLPEATYNALSQHLGQRGEVVPVTATTLWKQIAAAGLLVTEFEDNRMRTTIKCALKDSNGIKKRIRVLKIRKHEFENFEENKEAKHG